MKEKCKEKDLLERISQTLTIIKNSNSLSNDWEVGFLINILDQASARGQISEKQMNLYNKIEVKAVTYNFLKRQS